MSLACGNSKAFLTGHSYHPDTENIGGCRLTANMCGQNTENLVGFKHYGFLKIEIYIGSMGSYLPDKVMFCSEFVLKLVR